MVAYLVRKSFPGKYTDQEAIVAAEQITATMVPAGQPTPLFSICRTNLAEGGSSPNLSGYQTLAPPSAIQPVMAKQLCCSGSCLD
jgi:hypothetical protein